jgi:predicted phage terminase large subunit-like protein
MEKDPTYAANLRALPRIDRLRLEGGNWNVRAEAGMYFRREWFGVLDAIPAGWIRAVRYWDRAATEPSEANPDPDYTVGLKMYQYPNNTYLIVDIRRGQLSSLKVESLIRNTASADGPEVEQVGEQEPGAGGKADADNFIRLLSGYVVDVERSTTAKDVRAKPVSAQCEAGNISVLRAPWNEAFFAEVENFTGRDSGGHDDQVDCLAGAFNRLASAQRSILDAF